MHIYKFKHTLEDYDDFYFEIDILPTHTFLDFHNTIQKVLQLSGTELASFYMSNNTWKKKTEISLIDMNLDEETDIYEDDDENKPSKKKNLIMSETKLGKIIEDPHQRFIYIYDFLTPLTSYIELSKIVEEEKGVSYPICSKIVGELPTKKASIPLKSEKEDEEEILIELDDDLAEDSSDEGSDTNEFNNDENELGEGFDELKF